MEQNFQRDRKKRKICVNTAVTVLFLAAATATGNLFRHAGFPEANIVIVYILAVLLTARYTDGMVYGMAASVVATFTYNYFFTAPYFTLNVNNPSYLVTFAIMTVTAMIMSAATAKLKEYAADLKERSKVTEALYGMTSRLSNASNVEECVCLAVEGISETFGCLAGCLMIQENGKLCETFLQQEKRGGQMRRETRETSAYLNSLKLSDAGYRVEGTEFADWPFYGKNRILGMIRIPLQDDRNRSANDKKLLHALVENIGIAVERLIAINTQMKNQEMIEQERYKANLLRSISHDLRTPLAGILGTSEMLMDMTEQSDIRYESLLGIYQEAGWLHGMVENILSLTRLQDGKFKLSKTKEVVEEVVGSALQRIEKRIPDIEVDVKLPAEVLMVPMEPHLIEQVLINLLDNAVKHGKQEKQIEIVVKRREKEVEFAVRDRGEGIAEKDAENIFRTFYTTGGKGNDSMKGIGLGLAICEAIVNTHGGSIVGRNREDGSGAEFIFTLPMEERKES